MSEIHKFIQEIELRIQTIELAQEETNKILIDLNNHLNMLKTQVTNTHQTFNLLIENVNNKQKRVQVVQDNSDSSSDSFGSIEGSAFLRSYRERQDEHNRRQTILINSLSNSLRRNSVDSSDLSD